jgi:hypothetical protein
MCVRLCLYAVYYVSFLLKSLTSPTPLIIICDPSRSSCWYFFEFCVSFKKYSNFAWMNSEFGVILTSAVIYSYVGREIKIFFSSDRTDRRLE